MRKRDVKIARVATVSYAMRQIAEQVGALVDVGARLCLVCSEFDEVNSHKEFLGVDDLQPIFISREIDLFADFASLCRLFRLFRKRRFHIVHSTTPKAGLLCAIAGWLARVPIRLHTFTGQPWATRRGFIRHLLKACDWLIVRLNTRCYVDSESQRMFMVNQRVAQATQIGLIGAGSLAGVDLERFNSERFSDGVKKAMRASLGIPEDAFVILFIGRLNSEKGLRELYSAFTLLSADAQNVWLVMVGPTEIGSDAIFRESVGASAAKQIIFVGKTPEPELYIAISHLLCLPSYREGFGSVIIEAGAMSVPTVGTSIYGIVDAVEDGKTGLLVKPGKVDVLYEAFKTLVGDENLRLRLGLNARRRVETKFDSRLIAGELVREYERLLSEFSPITRGR